jgi:LPXTG-motif cell wall-anchored protein
MWMMSTTFLGKDKPDAPGAAPASQSVRADEQQNAGPALLGFALMAGGVLLLIVAARRKA